MWSELEQRLEAMLADAPEPDPGAGEEALHRALRALHPVAAPRRGFRASALAFATAVVVLTVAGASLGAAGALHVSFGTKAKQQPAPTQLVLPKGASGIAAVVDGRLQVVIKGGFRLQGLRVTAATLSPHARFVAVGIRHSLVAIAPGGRRPWSHRVGGKVVAIAWARDGIRIAYVVQNGHRYALHVIWGDGTHDTSIDRSVRPARPSWRPDSLAIAYVGAGGKAVVYDLGHRSHHLVADSPSDVTQVAYSTTGAKLALLGGGRVIVGQRRVATGFSVVGIGWLGRRLDLVGRNGRLGPIHVFARIDSFQSSGDAFAAVVSGRETHVLAGTGWHRVATVLSLPANSHAEAIVVR